MTGIRRYFFLLAGCFSGGADGGRSIASTLPATEAAGRVEHITVHAAPTPQRVAPGLAARYRQGRPDLGPLGQRDVLDTPFSVMDVPRDVLLNQQVRNINDTARYMPSVQLEERGDPNISRPQSRGFEADVIANSRLDGLNALITTPYAAEQFDPLTVLNGLAGALYGPQNPAGTFDYTLKRPTEKRLDVLNFGWDSGGAPMESLDVAGRHNVLGYRLNLLNQDGGSFVEGPHIRRDLVSGNFDVHLTDKITLQLNGSQYSTAFRGLPGPFSYGPNIQLLRAPGLKHQGYGQSQAGYNASTSTGLGKLLVEINHDWHLTLGGLYQNAARNVFTVNNQLLNNSGDYKQTIAAASTASVFKAWSNLAYLNGTVQTGLVTHRLVLGSNGYNLGNYNPMTAESYNLGIANIDHPNVVSSPQPRSSGRYQSANTNVQTLMTGDTLEIGQHISILGMVSWSWLQTRNWNKKRQKTSSYERNGAFAPTVALIYKPVSFGSVYFTWGRSLQAGPTAPSGASNAGEVLAPLRSEEYEIGTKWRVLNRLQLNMAAFRMTRPYAFANPATGLYSTGGRQRNYGVEFQASGSLTERLSVLGGVTWLDPQLGNTGVAATSHKEVVGVPPVMANILLDYRLIFLPRSAVNANIHYTGRRAANVTNTSFAGNYVTLDLGVRYDQPVLGRDLAFRFGVENVTNERYWASVYPASTNGASAASNTAMAGTPRMYHLTVSLAL